ncbi:WYL domain-containing protein [Gaopeijia maritima]|uniref:helix-turn-helix transcriptional regulator n=1 Tax=Gaopeijia maritima TaxID=3119007 RepID=UPI003246C2FB
MLHNDPTRRALRLLSLLQSRRRWGGAELAARLGVTERTVRRDIERLRDIGYPVQATPGADGGYRLSAGTSLPPLVFDDDEAVAVAVGLRAASGVAISGVEQAAVQALAKIEQVLPKRLRGRVSALDDSLVSLRRSRGDHEIVDPAVLVALAAACRDHEEVHFYYPRSEGDHLRRWVEPHQLLSAGSRWYLVAWDLGRDDWRTFRLDRLREVELAHARFMPREIPGGDAAAYFAASVVSLTPGMEVVVEVGAPYAKVAETLGATAHLVVEEAAGSCVLRLRGGGPEHLVEAVARLAVRAPVRVVAPDDVIAAVAALAGNLAGGGSS